MGWNHFQKEKTLLQEKETPRMNLTLNTFKRKYKNPN